MKINLGTVVTSHLNDALLELSYESMKESAYQRIRFVKALTFFNENLERDVTKEYLDWLWDEMFINDRVGKSFSDYKKSK